MRPPATTTAPLVVVLGTGGTIAQAGSREATVPVAELLNGHDVHVRIETRQVLQVTSPNITPEHWLIIATEVTACLARHEVTGVVVTHGTDTLEETAFFLDLCVRSEKPVVVVGSMRPSHDPETDGPANLRDAVRLAACHAAVGAGVLTVMGRRIQSARDVTKRHSVSLDALDSPNHGDLGFFDGDAVNMGAALPELPRFLIPAALPEVPVLYGYAGNRAWTAAVLAGVGLRGIVIAGTGAGSVPDELLPELAAIAKRGVAVVRSSRTGAGRVERDGEVDDTRYGFVAAGLLNPQKSRVLLMLCLADRMNRIEVQSMFDRCSLSALARDGKSAGFREASGAIGLD